GDPRPPGGAGGPGRVARRYRSAQRLVRRLRAHIARDPPRRRCGSRGRRARRRGRGGRPRCIRRAPGRLGAGRAPGDSRGRGRSGCGDPGAGAPRVRRLSGDLARRRRRDGAAPPRGRRGRRDERAHAAPPRARRGRGQPAGDGGVGAGPAGAATAILLAEHGVAVQLLDRARFPRPKICGEYLSPEAPRVLDRLGVLKTVDGLATPLAGMRITAPDGTVVIGTYRTVGDWRPYREHAMAIERARLDEALV